MNAVILSIISDTVEYLILNNLRNWLFQKKKTNGKVEDMEFPGVSKK